MSEEKTVEDVAREKAEALQEALKKLEEISKTKEGKKSLSFARDRVDVALKRTKKCDILGMLWAMYELGEFVESWYANEKPKVRWGEEEDPLNDYYRKLFLFKRALDRLFRERCICKTKK